MLGFVPNTGLGLPPGLAARALHRSTGTGPEPARIGRGRFHRARGRGYWSTGPAAELLANAGMPSGPSYYGQCGASAARARRGEISGLGAGGGFRRRTVSRETSPRGQWMAQCVHGQHAWWWAASRGSQSGEPRHATARTQSQKNRSELMLFSFASGRHSHPSRPWAFRRPGMRALGRRGPRLADHSPVVGPCRSACAHS